MKRDYIARAGQADQDRSFRESTLTSHPDEHLQVTSDRCVYTSRSTSPSPSKIPLLDLLHLAKISRQQTNWKSLESRRKISLRSGEINRSTALGRKTATESIVLEGVDPRLGGRGEVMDGRWKQKRVNCWPLWTSALETPSARPGRVNQCTPSHAALFLQTRRGAVASEERVSETSGYCIMYFSRH